TVDLSTTPAWVTGTIDEAPAGKTHFTDVAIDPYTDFPVASVNYVEQSVDAQNSQAGMSVFIIGPQSQQMWLNFSFGKMDGALDTTIDHDPVSGFFGVSTYAANENSVGKDPNDMYVRYINLGDLSNASDNVVKVSSGFGGEMLFPHLRFNPTAQRTRVMVRGSELFANDVDPASDTSSWVQYNEVANPGPFGSIAYNQAASGALFGTTYSKVLGGEHVLFYNSYDGEDDEPVVEVVDSIPIVGQDEWLAACSQLAYTWDAKPLIAYTVKDAVGAVTIKLAHKDSDTWVTETVSSTTSEAGNSPQDVRVDISVEPLDYFPDFTRTNRAFVVWNDISGSSGTVRVAYRAIQ
ncbi:MAG: hypothetical protein M3R04_09780, partial [bacterium]|nr:hypothetical protein [bacterium]